MTTHTAPAETRHVILAAKVPPELREQALAYGLRHDRNLSQVIRLALNALFAAETNHD